MAAEWAARRGARVSAATVDHRLAAGERGRGGGGRGAFSETLGVPHKTLVWTGAEAVDPAAGAGPRGALPAARSTMRGRSAPARSRPPIMPTIRPRPSCSASSAARASPASPAWRRRACATAMTIARPLLGVEKSDLVAFCRSRGAAFTDDPSNANPRFARPRLRLLLDRLGEEGLTAEGLVRLARRAAEADEALRAHDRRGRSAGSAPTGRSTQARCSPSRSRSSSGCSARRIAASRRAGRRPHRPREDRSARSAAARRAREPTRARRQCRRRARPAQRRREGSASRRSRRGDARPTAARARRPSPAPNWVGGSAEFGADRQRAAISHRRPNRLSLLRKRKRGGHHALGNRSAARRGPALRFAPDGPRRRDRHRRRQFPRLVDREFDRHRAADPDGAAFRPRARSRRCCR